MNSLDITRNLREADYSSDAIQRFLDISPNRTLFSVYHSTKEGIINPNTDIGRNVWYKLAEYADRNNDKRFRCLTDLAFCKATGAEGRELLKKHTRGHYLAWFLWVVTVWDRQIPFDFLDYYKSSVRRRYVNSKLD